MVTIAEIRKIQRRIYSARHYYGTYWVFWFDNDISIFGDNDRKNRLLKIAPDHLIGHYDKNGSPDDVMDDILSRLTGEG